MGGKTTELEAALAQEKAARLRIESRMRAAERKAEESIRRVKDLEKENQALTLKVCLSMRLACDMYVVLY